MLDGDPKELERAADAESVENAVTHPIAFFDDPAERGDLLHLGIVLPLFHFVEIDLDLVEDVRQRVQGGVVHHDTAPKLVVLAIQAIEFAAVHELPSVHELPTSFVRELNAATTESM